jgi:hypothetical protein
MYNIQFNTISDKRIEETVHKKFLGLQIDLFKLENTSQSAGPKFKREPISPTSILWN